MICVGDKKIADTTPDLTAYALQEDVDNEFENVVYKTDISKNITSDSTDAQVASAKAVFTGLANKPEIDDDDEGESELTVWSAKKVHDELENATKIDDTSTTATDATWSAKKISDSLVDLVGDLSQLVTTDKSNLVGAVNEVQKKANSNVVNRKASVASMGVDYRFDGENHLDFYVNDTPLELATMDKVAKYPDWSNQQKINQTEITLDQDIYIELNQLTSDPTENLKINGKDVSVSDFSNGLYSTRFSGYVKKGSVVSHPYLNYQNLVRVFPLV